MALLGLTIKAVSIKVTLTACANQKLQGNWSADCLTGHQPEVTVIYRRILPRPVRWLGTYVNSHWALYLNLYRVSLPLNFCKKNLINNLSLTRFEILCLKMSEWKPRYPDGGYLPSGYRVLGSVPGCASWSGWGVLGWPGNQSQHFLLHHVLNTDRKAAECESSFSQIDESFLLGDDVKKKW